jgi:hypothetical protein
MLGAHIMFKTSGKWLLFFLGAFLLIALSFQAANQENKQERQNQKEKEDLTRLNSEDKVQLVEFFRLKKIFGGQVWPGFGEAEIPLILYNERYEFLVAHPDPPAPWITVDNDTFQGKLYYRRTIEKAQAFAVPVGDLWVASLDTLSHMNRSMKKQLREKIPAERLTPGMLKMMEISPAQHVVSLLHEAFHAFQAMRNQARFLRANSMYSSEKHYPFKDEVFKDAWNQEGSLLASALREKDETERLGLIRRFLEIRTKRRSDSSLSQELISLEREFEWLEGLAKYAEMRFAELGSSLQEEAELKAFRIVQYRLRMDFSSRLNKLGNLHGDLRFYLSGAIQAMILDKISPGWKQEIMHQENIGVEDLLQTKVLNKRHLN